MMICLKCAARRYRDPQEQPCARCVVDSMRNPIAEVRASLDRYIAEVDARYEHAELRGLPVRMGTGRPYTRSS